MDDELKVVVQVLEWRIGGVRQRDEGSRQREFSLDTTSVVGKQSARAMRFGWFSCICMVIFCRKRMQTRTCECDMGTCGALLHAAYVDRATATGNFLLAT